LLLDQGVPLEVVSAVLGHAGPAITADVYVRLTEDSKRRHLDWLGVTLPSRRTADSGQGRTLRRDAP
jgi:integrase